MSNPMNAKYVLTCMQLLLFLLRFMPSVARRKQKNTQKAQQKKMEREKEAKKKLARQQLPPKGKKR
jgi:Na+-transporting methylmalonyl-CoA/oxaloacetate decarboxylase gamma subunit